MNLFNSLEQTVSKVQLLELEKQLNITLPKDYNNFLLQINVGIPTGKYLSFYINELHEEVFLGILLGFSENKNFNLFDWNFEYLEELPERSLIFATEYGDGLFVMITEGDNQGVYFWDHTFIFEQSSEESNVYFLADSFTHFIENLYFTNP